MNEFIEFRNHIYDASSHYIYPLLFLDNYISTNKTINLKESILIKNIQIIKEIESKKNICNNDVCELCSFLGDNLYIDRFILDIILKFYDDDTKNLFKEMIIFTMEEKKYNSQKLYHILDICIECNMDILKNSDILFILEKYKLDLDVFSILMDYMDSFKRDGFKDNIYDLLSLEYPDSIKIQILNLLVSLYSIEKVDESYVKKNIRHEKNKIFYDSYINFLNSNLKFEKHGISILQSMFYGDFEDSGKGNNGGLAVLLKDLGDEISKDKRVSFVFTITIDDKLNKPFISYYGENHLFIRLPIYLDSSIGDPFIKRELFIKRYIGNFLKKSNIEPDIFHIRYLDNASKAVAYLSKELRKKLVFTLTPDPHRNMFDESGHLKQLSFKELIEKLNKIKIGDELIYKSDGIIGIGNEEVEKELEIYFPQFNDENIKKKLKMISEGVQIDKYINEKDSERYLIEFVQKNKINESFFDRPILLNVGRLSIQKGQIELLKAWSNSKLCQTHNLLIVGGDLEEPNKEEEIIINFFKDYLEKYPELKDKFIHKGAMSNENIKLLEKSIINKDLDLPHIYISSSIKEEFGIAILEAMSKGFLTMGPIKGGVKSYMKNGKNGFLIDTSSWETIARDSEKYIYDSKIEDDGFKKIQLEGQKTVDEQFSMREVASKFLSFYLLLKGVEDYEI